jgi:hypothetical protein
MRLAHKGRKSTRGRKLFLKTDEAQIFNGATTFGVMTLSIKTFSIITLSVTTLSMMTLSETAFRIMTLSVTTFSRKTHAA